MKLNSSFIVDAEYVNGILTLVFKNGNTYNYGGVPGSVFNQLTTAESPSRYYQQNIKGKFSTINNQYLKIMKPDKVIKLRIDVTKIKKEWLFKGEKGTYADVTLLYTDEQDSHGNNGMIVQDVPKEVYKADKSVKGPILGNGKVWGSAASANESSPQEPPTSEDLPF